MAANIFDRAKQLADEPDNRNPATLRAKLHAEFGDHKQLSEAVDAALGAESASGTAPAATGGRKGTRKSGAGKKPGGTRRGKSESARRGAAPQATGATCPEGPRLAE
jgi:hypothetical protein